MTELLKRIEELREELGTIRWSAGISDRVGKHLETAEAQLHEAVEALHDEIGV